MTGMRGLRDRKYRREPGSSARVLTLGAGTEKADLETHTANILDEPCQILLFQLRENASIFSPTKEVVELFVKLWGSFVQVMELSKETGRDHGMASSYENSQRFTD